MSTVSASAGGQGKLAQVIAARGGQAKAEAPFVIEHREALIYMLCEAAELEHAIMCQYLFAAFSLKQTVDEGLTQEEIVAVTRWRRQIAHVATQEMLHLGLVHNLLSAVGAAPHLGRPNMPAPAHHYPPGVNLTLVPFGEPALRHFMFLERPEGMRLKGAAGIDAPVEQAVPLMAEADIVPQLQDFATVGHLYRSIEQGIAHLAAKFGEPGLFVGPPRAQATATVFGWSELVPVTDVASAQRAIDTILEQGEGARGDWQDAHFGQFVAILDEYRQMRAARPDFDPVRPVIFATVRPCEHADGTPVIGDPITARCTDLFNVGYEVLLQMLERYFAHTEETDAQLGTLAEATLALMRRVLKPLGDLLTTLPAGPDHPGRTVGPSFELFYESDYLMPHREAAWALLEERLRDAVDFCDRIQSDASHPLVAGLAPVGRALGEIADSLAAHFGEWGGVSRHARRDPETPALDPGELASLRTRAADLATAVAGVPAADEASRSLAGLFTDTYRVLVAAMAGAERAPAAGTSPPRQVAARMIDSVLRPLAQAFTDPLGQAPQAPQPGPDVMLVTQEARDSSDASSLHEQLWVLAQLATHLRTSLADDTRAASLLEATACLQELAVGLAPPEGPSSAETRLARLRELQAELSCGIQAAVNGPYLVTNAEHVYDWLGEALPTRPQMALCRCGGSAIKPLCDGTHARIGFTSAKDPKRVPDRTDTYAGQQVTILDNRGICQHSGFCTDRLASVFHVEGDPFVTPSGGRLDEIIRAVRDCPSGALSYAIDGREAREQVDFNGRREPAIEVSKDGPYRITGGVPLRDGEGNNEPRRTGASLEHYALCRCGHSQNKPFCSGMHWYVNFHDPVPDPEQEPTLFEWAGGLPAVTRMTRLFYEKYVPQEPLLAPLFASMSADHAWHVATWLGETLGGPKRYSAEHGGYPRMLSQHLGKAITEAQRARWVSLLGQCAQEAGLPADPEFRSAFVSYLEWGSRIVLENSQPAAQPPPNMPMPRWDWGTAGPPGSRVSALAPQPAEAEPVKLPSEGETVSFARHIKALFRPMDRQSMQWAFDLWVYEDVAKHADAILERLQNGSMPCDTRWSAEKVEAFHRWVRAGKQP